ncbi:MAG TPA: DNRLRE domain-containing protein, partial [Anaerolineae bacterium]|nr:DNRLRE domain-containing protein [Anaerolineae bacterium]
MTGVAGQITSGMTNLTAVADTYIYHKAPDANYGTLATLKLNNRTGNPVSKQAIVRSLLRFDLSAIPAGATVLSASLNVVQDNTSSGLIDVCEATASWGETVATWNNSSAIFGAAYYGSTNTGTTAGGAVLIPLNESGIDKVRSWMGTPAENYGLG